MLHMFGHGRRKENIILVPYVHSFFVCAFIHVLHGRLYYVSILLLHRQSRHTIVTTDWPLGLVVPNPSGTTRGPHVDVNSCQRQHEPDLRHAVMCCAVLCYAMICLCCDVMCCSVLCCAVKLCCAVLCCAVLCCAVLCCAVLCCAVL